MYTNITSLSQKIRQITNNHGDNLKSVEIVLDTILRYMDI